MIVGRWRSKTKNAGPPSLRLDATDRSRRLLRRRCRGMDSRKRCFSQLGSTVLSATCLHKAASTIASRLCRRVSAQHFAARRSAFLARSAGREPSSSYSQRRCCCGHGSDEATKRHYRDRKRDAESGPLSARAPEALAGDPDGLIAPPPPALGPRAAWIKSVLRHRLPSLTYPTDRLFPSDLLTIKIHTRSPSVVTEKVLGELTAHVWRTA